jgi:hypothetical protein
MIQTRNNTSKQQEVVKLKTNNATFKMSLVIFTLFLVMTLSVTSNYLFFKELLVSSGIILFITVIKFFEIKQD